MGLAELNLRYVAIEEDNEIGEIGLGNKVQLYRWAESGVPRLNSSLRRGAIRRPLVLGPVRSVTEVAARAMAAIVMHVAAVLALRLTVANHAAGNPAAGPMARTAAVVVHVPAIASMGTVSAVPRCQTATA